MNDADQTADSVDSGVELDPDQLSSEALRGLVEEFVSREGTDYGPGDWTLDDKVGQVLRQIERGEARIVFDPELESASIVETGETGETGPTQESAISSRGEKP